LFCAFSDPGRRLQSLSVVFAALPGFQACCTKFMSVARTRQTFVMISQAMAASCGAFATPTEANYFALQEK
jgi:predicted double-glycine peptidase